MINYAYKNYRMWIILSRQDYRKLTVFLAFKAYKTVDLGLFRGSQQKKWTARSYLS